MSVALRIRIYAGLLFALVVVFVLGTVFGPRRNEPLGPLFPGLSEVSVSEIEIGAGGARISLRRQGEGWLIEEGRRSYPAREDRISSFVDEMVGSELVRRVTSNERLWPDFGLTDDGGVRLVVGTDGDASREVVEVFWGSEASETGLSYVRRGSEPDVYATGGRLGFYLRQPVSYWSYLRVLPEDLLPSQAISLSGTINAALGEDEVLDTSYDLVRIVGEESESGGERWVAAGSNETLDDDAVERLVRDIVDLVGRDFIRSANNRLDERVGTVNVAFADGRTYRISVFRIDGGFACSAEGEGLPGDEFGGLSYVLTEATVRRMFPDLARLTTE